VKANGETKELGTLTKTKGGYMIEVTKNEDLKDYPTIRILRNGKAVLETAW